MKNAIIIIIVAILAALAGWCGAKRYSEDFIGSRGNSVELYYYVNKDDLHIGALAANEVPVIQIIKNDEPSAAQESPQILKAGVTYPVTVKNKEAIDISIKCWVAPDAMHLDQVVAGSDFTLKDQEKNLYAHVHSKKYRLKNRHSNQLRQIGGITISKALGIDKTIITGPVKPDSPNPPQ